MKTADIEEKIKNSRRFNTKMIKENPPPTFSDYLAERMDEKNIKKSSLIKALNIDRSYGYQIINGTRSPTRTQLIKIGLFLGLDLAQMQKMLNLANREALYVRRPEDAKAVHCIEHKIEFKKACDFIWGKKDT